MISQHRLKCSRGGGQLDVTPVREADGAREPWSDKGDATKPRTSLEDHVRDDSDAESSFDKAEHRIELTAFDRDARLDSMTTECGQSHLAQVVSLTEKHKGIADEVSHAHRPSTKD